MPMRPLLVILCLGLLSTTAHAQQPRRGDIAVGASLKGDEVTEFTGVTLTGGRAITTNLDVVAELSTLGGELIGYVISGERDGYGPGDTYTSDARITQALGGVRAAGHLRRAPRWRFFAHGLAGWRDTRFSAPLSYISASGVALQSGFGVDIPIGRVWFIRPQADFLFGKTTDYTSFNRRGTFSIVRLFR